MLRQINKFALEDRGFTIFDGSYMDDDDTSERKKGLHPAILSHNISVSIKNGVAYMQLAYKLKPEFDQNNSLFDINNWDKYNTPEYIIQTSNPNYAYIRVKQNIFDLSNLSEYIRKHVNNTECNTIANNVYYANTSHFIIVSNSLYAYSYHPKNTVPYIGSGIIINNGILINYRNPQSRSYLGEKKLLNKNNIYLLYYKNIKYKGGKYNMLRVSKYKYYLYKYIFDPIGNTNPLISSYQIHIISDRSGVRFIALRFTGRTDLSDSEIIKYNNEWSELFYDVENNERFIGILISKDPILPYSEYVYSTSIMVEGIGNTSNNPWSKHFIIYKGKIYFKIGENISNTNEFTNICVGNEIIRGILVQEMFIEKKKHCKFKQKNLPPKYKLN